MYRDNDPEHVCANREKEALYDARGIFCCYTCPICEDRKRREYRADIFNDPDYEADEDIEGDAGYEDDLQLEDDLYV